ncbi:MAG: trypsin-like serine protease [Myxococcales bacterium]|nr:trypsin-like serine protease [Myxococcales bacterium]
MLPSRQRFAAFLPLLGLVAFGACHPAGDPEGEVRGQTAAIIGGTADTTDTWVVGIDIGGGGVCSGALIAPNLVLTARHCVSKTPAKLDCSPDGGLATNKVLSNYPASSFQVSTAQYYKNAPRWSVAAVRYINDAVCTGGSTDPACRLCGYDLALLQLNKGSRLPHRLQGAVEPRAEEARVHRDGLRLPEGREARLHAARLPDAARPGDRRAGHRAGLHRLGAGVRG